MQRTPQRSLTTWGEDSLLGPRQDPYWLFNIILNCSAWRQPGAYICRNGVPCGDITSAYTHDESSTRICAKSARAAHHYIDTTPWNTYQRTATTYLSFRSAFCRIWKYLLKWILSKQINYCNATQLIRLKWGLSRLQLLSSDKIESKLSMKWDERWTLFPSFEYWLMLGWWALTFLPLSTLSYPLEFPHSLFTTALLSAPQFPLDTKKNK